jgi:glycosyltransferase involved in cell wall biosynthesis
MGQRAFFSIVIPTYNRPRELAKCLQSLVYLEYPRDSFEVIVVDDGSQMPLREIVATLCPQLQVVFIALPHAGPAAARNAGAERANGTFLAFTDDDCTVKSDWLQQLAAGFVKTPEHLIGGCTLNALLDNPYSTASQLIVDLVYSYYNADPAHARFFASNNMAIPAYRFHELGGFDSSFRTSEDRDFCDRWLQHGYEMTYAAEAVVYHAHPLTLRTFWRQHFGYGRGAFRFHKNRAQRGSGPFRPDLQFYLNLVRYPFNGHNRRALFSMLVVWQLANTAGFIWELAKGARPRSIKDKDEARNIQI